MPVVQKTPTQQFIESAAFIYRACCELDQASSTQHDLGRLAQREYGRLESLMRKQIRDWNGALDTENVPPDLAVYECTGAAADAKGCEIFTTDRDRFGSMCGPCRARLCGPCQARLYRQEMAQG